MPQANPVPDAPPPDYNTIANQFAAAKRRQALEATEKSPDAAYKEQKQAQAQERKRERLEARRKASYESRWLWTVGFWVWMLLIHAGGIYYFTSGFLLTRLVLDEHSNCTVPPITPALKWPGSGTFEGGCWHPKTFNRAVVILIDALRYDFTVPVVNASEAQVYHNAFPFLHETSLKSPNNAFLRPFIADPPTTTLQRLKGLTTGTLPTFIDAGSNFAGTAIEEDNLLMQWRHAGKGISHLGDDTWNALFPGYFDPKLSHPYDSFNVWDLHTVDNGVLEHIFPLMQPDRKNEWELLIGHFLGVDHAGHRYGPDHPAMASKLQQMDMFIRDLVELIDDDTLLVVMGDHGMDGKGDHGGESDDEVEAALWMYSSRPVFGRTNPEYATPPATAKIRPVDQIDLVPTLALLLGIPIPYNNLGRPIEEAFAGKNGQDWRNLAAASLMTSAGIKRYQASYFAARGLDQPTEPGSPLDLWAEAESKGSNASSKKGWTEAYDALTRFQEETLRICKDLWARFDISRMVLGIIVMALGLLILLIYVARDEDEDFAVLDDAELDFAEKSLELQGVEADASLPSYQTLSKEITKAAMLGGLPAFVATLLSTFANGDTDFARALTVSCLGSLAMVVTTLAGMGKTIRNLLPSTPWGWLAAVFTISQSIGFASNSYTIWEDSILLFFTTTFGFATAISAFRIPSLADRSLALYHSVLFVLLGRLASFSKLCREEQMPYCTSTFYASASSSTSAPWQLLIPYVVSLVLPSMIKAYLVPTKSYEGLAPGWIGYVFRTGLFMSAVFWTIDSADDGAWFPSLEGDLLKTSRVYLAQLVLALAFVAGSTAFAWAPPCVSILTSAANKRTARVSVLGYGNAHGARYLLLPLNILGACILLSKPMGGGALAIMMWQVLSLVEILDLNSLGAETIGPIMLGVLGNYHFFKTGHQAVLSSIQWDTAFVPSFTIRYPWSPLAVAINTFAGHILAAAAVPLVVLWKVGPKRKAVLESVSRALGIFVVYFAVEALATMAWAGHLRRHLMLYRVFSPRFMTAAVALLLVDVVAIVAALTGVRANTFAISEVFGWAD